MLEADLAKSGGRGVGHGQSVESGRDKDEALEHLGQVGQSRGWKLDARSSKLGVMETQKRESWG
jgi:hypothetical protein